MEKSIKNGTGTLDPGRLGQNIRLYRTLRGITQTELARRLFVAPQSVSKWERGENIPDLGRFYALARELGASMEALVGSQMEEQTYIGIDGGGTKTEFVLINRRGELLNHIVLGPSNPNTCGLEGACGVVLQGLAFFCPREMNVHGIFFGGAGLGTGNYAKEIRARLRKEYPDIEVNCGSDILNVIACSSQPDNCIAAISGTGAAVFATENDRLVRAGGGGYLFDRGGSGYDMGRAAIAAALEDRDGTGPATRLTALVEQALGGSAWDHIAQLYQKDVAYIASFAPLVQQAYREKDDVACAILEGNALRLAQLIAACRKKAPRAKVLVLAGSQLQKNEDFLRQVAQRLDPDLKLELPDWPPVWGACLRCMRLCGVEELPTPERFLKEYAAKGKEE